MAQPLVVNLPHQLGTAEAKRRIRSGLVKARGNVPMISSFTESWAGDQMSFAATAVGQTLTGRVDVGEREIRIEVDLPWFLAALAAKIRPQVEEQGRRLLEP